MTTAQEKAQCVSWFIETKSDAQTQRNYRSKYGRDPPSRPSIRLWHKKFMERGTVFDARRIGRPRTSKENIERVRQVFQRSPLKSIPLLQPGNWTYHVQQCAKPYTNI